MIDLLKQNWNFGRVIRLAFGSYILIVSLMEGQYFLASAGAFFVYQSIANVGCGICLPLNHDFKEPKGINNKTEVEYEEI